MNLAKAVEDYYAARELQWPTVDEAMQWLATEFGEANELLLHRRGDWVRNNPNDAPVYSEEAFAEELGDIILMAMVAGIVEGEDPLLSLMQKMKRKVAEASAE